MTSKPSIKFTSSVLSAPSFAFVFLALEALPPTEAFAPLLAPRPRPFPRVALLLLAPPLAAPFLPRLAGGVTSLMGMSSVSSGELLSESLSRSFHWLEARLGVVDTGSLAASGSKFTAVSVDNGIKSSVSCHIGERKINNDLLARCNAKFWSDKQGALWEICKWANVDFQRHLVHKGTRANKIGCAKTQSMLNSQKPEKNNCRATQKMCILQHAAFHKKLQEELTSSCGAVSIWLSWDSSTLVHSAGSYKASLSSVPVAVVSRCSSILSSVMKESSFTWSIPSMSTSKSAASSPRSCSSWSEDCGATTNLVICTCKEMVRFDSCARWETGTQYDVSITCFRFGKISPHTNFVLIPRF